jgi:hypothetical protein
MIKTLTQAEIEELRRLRDEYPKAVLAAAPPQTLPPDHAMEGDLLAKWIEADARVGRILARMKELEGE